MATCGRTETITLTGGTIANTSILSVDFSKSGNKIDTTAIGSGEYGDFVVCTYAGTLTIASSAVITGVVTAFAVPGFNGNCKESSSGVTVDPKGITTYTYVYDLNT